MKYFNIKAADDAILGPYVVPVSPYCCGPSSGFSYV